MMLRTAIALALLGLATPAAAEEDVPYDLAMSRLRGCVMVGVEGAPRDNYQAALVSVRSFCLPRIRLVYAIVERQAAADNPQADADTLAELKKSARRKIDYDIAVAVSKIGGFQP